MASAMHTPVSWDGDGGSIMVAAPLDAGAITVIQVRADLAGIGWGTVHAVTMPGGDARMADVREADAGAALDGAFIAHPKRPPPSKLKIALIFWRCFSSSSRRRSQPRRSSGPPDPDSEQRT